MGKANYPRSTGTKGVFTGSGRFHGPLSHRHRRRRRERGEPSESTPKAEIVIQSPALLLLERGGRNEKVGSSYHVTSLNRSILLITLKQPLKFNTDHFSDSPSKNANKMLSFKTISMHKPSWTPLCLLAFLYLSCCCSLSPVLKMLSSAIATYS
jgi:hypothetical protein